MLFVFFTSIIFYCYRSNQKLKKCLPTKTQRTQSLVFVSLVALWVYIINRYHQIE
jgi:hypothetical protein